MTNDSNNRRAKNKAAKNNTVKDKTVRFGIGKYEAVSDEQERLFIRHVRNFFMQAVSKLVPEVSEELENELLPLYQQMPLLCYEAASKAHRKAELKALFYDEPASEWAEFKRSTDESKRFTWVDRYQPTWESLEMAWSNSLASATPEDITPEERYVGRVLRSRHPFVFIDYKSANNDGSVAVFVEKVVDWSRRHNLDEVWCREHAYKTLDVWCYEEDWREAHVWAWEPYNMPYWFHPIPTIKGSPRGELVFKYSTFYPGKGTRQEARDEIMSAFKKRLNEFLDERERAAREQGMESIPRKFDTMHFDWLALHQVRKPPMSCQQISADLPYKTTERAVQKAIKQLADQIGLTPRYIGRGRKPKSLTKRH